jgi:hypothetical protein
VLLLEKTFHFAILLQVMNRLLVCFTQSELHFDRPPGPEQNWLCTSQASAKHTLNAASALFCLKQSAALAF